MQILDGKKLDYDDILIVPQRSDHKSREDVLLHRIFKFKYAKSNPAWLPVIASNMFNIGTKAMSDIFYKYNMLTAIHKFYDKDDWFNWNRNNTFRFITIGQNDEDIEYVQRIHKNSPYNDRTYMINIDVANGYRSSFVDFVKMTREKFPQDVIMAGNVCTPEMTQELILAGADIVKIGIGPGSVCQTRIVTGVGYPQLSAIIECANAAHGLKGHIAADGGCRTSGDIAKAFCAGADLVMIGGMLAGTDECEGEWVYDNETTKINKRLRFYGMSSHEAMEKHGGSEKDYRASEGQCIEVPYKGPVENVIKEILGGLRSCGTYIGANCIKDFPKCATFCRIR